MPPSQPPPPPHPASIRTVILHQLTQDPELPRPNPTTSLWQVPGNAAVANVQSTKLPATVDYAIIGSGIAALGVARGLLTNAASGTRSVAIFEARSLCSGATGRNGGQLTRLPPTRHSFLAENFGIEQANKILRLTVRGLREMHAAAASFGPEFEAFTQVTPLEKFFAYFDEVSWLETLAALELYEREVPEDRGAYEIVSKEEVAEKYKLKNACGGVRLAAGTISPYNLVTGSLQKLLEAYPTRFSIDTNTPITAIAHGADTADTAYPYTLQTPRGAVSAAHVIHCTNGHAGHLLPSLRGKMYPRRGTMSVQVPGPRFPDLSKKQSWSFYFSPALDRHTGAVETGRYYGLQNGQTGDLWVGGDRDGVTGFITSDDSDVDYFANQSLRTLVPRLFSSDWVDAKPAVRGLWSGIMCYTADHLPLVGRLPASTTNGRAGSGEWIAAGWNTYGMTNGLICGDALAKMMLGLDVSSYFPEAYLPTEKRLDGERFKLRNVLLDYFDRIGATPLLAKM